VLSIAIVVSVVVLILIIVPIVVILLSLMSFPLVLLTLMLLALILLALMSLPLMLLLLMLFPLMSVAIVVAAIMMITITVVAIVAVPIIAAVLVLPLPAFAFPTLALVPLPILVEEVDGRCDGFGGLGRDGCCFDRRGEGGGAGSMVSYLDSKSWWFEERDTYPKPRMARRMALVNCISAVSASKDGRPI
jgi:hypothetical protein